MKKLLILAVALMLALSFGACGTPAATEPAATEAPAAPAEPAAPPESAAPAPESGEQPYIILVNALVGHPVYEQQAEAARKAAEDYGVNLEIIGPTFGTSTLVTDYIAAMENAITLEPDAIIGEPFDPSLFEVFSRAKQAGIPMFLTSNLLENEDDFIAWIGTDNYNYGVNAADMIAEKTGGKANICVVMGDLATTNQVEQRKGLEERIEEKYPDMKVVNVVADKNDLAAAMTVTEDTLNTYPETDCFVMLESTGGPGVAQVCAEMNREDALILDIDAVEATIDNIKAGKVWATLAQNFYKRGYESVRMAYEYLTEGSGAAFAKLNDSGTVLIDANNVVAYEENLWEEIVFKGTPWPAK
ncbi:MAG TPA: sugar ABC transporter substrate-binding protein [Feifaniaceae bacterium]|nr:sugar ABC transporter substrate-binding protein [Feifaniaceae bacterium]